MITAIHSGRNPLVAGRMDDNSDGFIDNAVKVYKIINGVETLVRTESAFPDDWCGGIKCQEEMVLNPAKHDTKRKRARCPQRPAPPKEELWRVYRELGPCISPLAKKYGAGFATVRRWLREYGIIDVHNVAMER